MWKAILIYALAFADIAMAEEHYLTQLQIQTTNSHAVDIPSPLTLKWALTQADAAHPELVREQARVSLAIAAQHRTRSDSSWNLDLHLEPRWAERAADNSGQIVNDSRAALTLSRQLFDFGRSRANRLAASASVSAQKNELVGTRWKRRLDIMQAYFSVLLADLKHRTDDELMRPRHFDFYQAQHRQQVGDATEVEVSAFETIYREALTLRTLSELEQSRQRRLLALALNLPDHIPVVLEIPELKANDRTVPEIEHIVSGIQKVNPLYLSKVMEIRAAKSRLVAAKAARRPVINMQALIQEYEQESGLRDDARLALEIEIPLYKGGQTAAVIEAREAELSIAQAELGLVDFELRQRVITLIQKLHLLEVDRETARLREDARSVAFDRAQALHETEQQADFGESMARLTEAQWLAAKADYETALAWEELMALVDGHDEYLQIVEVEQ